MYDAVTPAPDHLHKSLDEIGIEFGTDKASTGHDYLRFYERYFSPIREQHLKILEIGVYKGASVRTWENYFPNAHIVGVDINPSASSFATDRITIELADQSNVQDLVNLGVKHGPFDIVIEDGSHFWEHQTTTLRSIFPFVKDLGYYVIEDLQTNYGMMRDKYKGVASFSCVEYLKRLVDTTVADEHFDLQAEEDAFVRSFGSQIGFIAFRRHVCLIEKSYNLNRVANPRRRLIDAAGTPLLPLLEVKDSPLHGITAHIGNMGDIKGSSYINPAAPRARYIQGFSIVVDPLSTEEIEYRVRDSMGEWSGWSAGNQFAGSRGQGQNLTGYAVRLSGALRDIWDLKVVGAFDGIAAPVTVATDQDCIPADLFRPLRAMQLVFTKK